MATPTDSTPATMLATLEEAYGGRQVVLDQLSASTDPRAIKVAQLLSDPTFKVSSLADVAKAAEVAPGTLLILLKDGAVSRAVAHAALRLQRRLPTIVDKVADAAEGGFEPCSCTVGGQRPAVPDCSRCAGFGQVPVRGSLPHQELVLDVLGMLPKTGPLVAVNNTVQNSVSVGNIFDQFVKSPAAARTPAPVIDVTPTAIKE